VIVLYRGDSREAYDGYALLFDILDSAAKIYDSFLGAFFAGNDLTVSNV
jgi:hypothetical protein